VGVYRVERSVDQTYLKLGNGIAGQYAVRHRSFETFLYRWDVFFWNRTTHDLVNELQPAFVVIRINRRNDNLDVGKLTAATGLLLVRFAMLRRASNGFFVRYLRGTLVYLHLKLTPQAVDQNIQVQLAHSGNYRLPGFLVGIHHECWVLLGKLSQGHA